MFEFFWSVLSIIVFKLNQVTDTSGYSKVQFIFSIFSSYKYRKKSNTVFDSVKILTL